MKNMTVVLALVLLLAGTGTVLAGPSDAFATDGWRHQAAAIVAGEAPAGCRNCYELTACQIIREARTGNPWSVVIAGPGRRWHGSRAPQQEHLQAVNRMLSSDCDQYPVCRFLGNANDLLYWRRVYPVLVHEVVGFCNENGCSMCVVKNNPPATSTGGFAAYCQVWE